MICPTNITYCNIIKFLNTSDVFKFYSMYNKSKTNIKNLNKMSTLMTNDVHIINKKVYAKKIENLYYPFICLIRNLLKMIFFISSKVGCKVKLRFSTNYIHLNRQLKSITINYLLTTVNSIQKPIPSVPEITIKNPVAVKSVQELINEKQLVTLQPKSKC